MTVAIATPEVFTNIQGHVMPPAMTSPRGPPARASGTLNGTIPRREPLRRLYPLQRSRTASDSIREVTNRPDAENIPDMGNMDAAYTSGKRRAPVRASSVSGATGHNMAASGKFVTHRAYTASPDRSATISDKQNHSRPSLIRRSSDIGSVTSYASSCPVHGGSDVSSSTSSYSRQGSILKRPSSRRVRDLTSMALAPKQVQFAPNVSVVHMDEDGEHLSTQYQELNGEKRKRMGTLSRPSFRNYDNVIYITDNLPASNDQRRSQNYHQGSSSSQHASRDSSRFRDLFKRLNSNGSLMRESELGEENATPLKRGQFNITFSNRTGEPTKLRFVLHMGPEYNPNDLVVKANTTGSRIRVIATSAAPSRGGSEEFNEKYMLPMDIDPYEIEARLDKWGNLTVEAPLLTSDKRVEVNKTNNVLCAIYV